MEEPISDERTMSEHLYDASSSASLRRRRKGGLITMPFIIANEAFEKVASYGLVPNMILYFIGDYHLSVAKGTNILFFWTAATNFMPILGAFLSDSYLGRFLTIGLGSIISLLGMTLLWLTAMIPEVKPPPCDMLSGQICQAPTASQMTLLISSFILMSIGAGGIRPCSIAFGADQLDRRDNPKNERVIESFFGWYYASAAISVVIALTGIVYIQDHYGWRVGFGVPAILMFLSAFLFFLASPIYVKMKASTSLFTGFAQVAVVAYKNRKLPLPPSDSTRCYHRKKGSDLLVPTKKLRFLNKACIIRNPEQDIAQDGTASNPWRLCTIEQVEELKALLKVIPLWSTGIMMSINISQNSFPVLQASSMDRHITSSFQIPAGSFGMFTVITLAIWVVLYDRAILPLASKIKGKPVRLGVKLRMGIGLLLSCLGMVVSGIVENARRRKAIQEGYLNNPKAVVDMSAMWLIPQHLLNGLAEAFNAIGQTEFYYSEFPKSMSSVASALFGLGMAVANLLASLIVSTVDNVTSKGNKESWVSSNINKGHYDNYYWLLAILSLINMIYFLVCSWAYGPCVERIASANVEGNGIREEEEPSGLGARIGDESNGLKGEDLPKSREL
ncbi:protein NRT1/ PTR FAMILY 1.2-like [Mangifera indica]|uniref:protein NRT1/ PTR FAMILY 1.2-like n=1 Tax=Mangifera indica TaxID=29780 RepID=UPI001CF9D059|nr:protein NRT1/ PTR FAMILY 1.2-like [Mangifera indica]